jgi:hypothetical protein
MIKKFKSFINEKNNQIQEEKSDIDNKMKEFNELFEIEIGSLIKLKKYNNSNIKYKNIFNGESIIYTIDKNDIKIENEKQYHFVNKSAMIWLRTDEDNNSNTYTIKFELKASNINKQDDKKRLNSISLFKYKDDSSDMSDVIEKFKDYIKKIIKTN